MIGVGETPVNRSPLQHLVDLPSQELADIAHFFECYNAAQGRDFKVTGRGDRRAAETALAKAMRAFESQKKAVRK